MDYGIFFGKIKVCVEFQWVDKNQLGKEVRGRENGILRRKENKYKSIEMWYVWGIVSSFFVLVWRVSVDEWQETGYLGLDYGDFWMMGYGVLILLLNCEALLKNEVRVICRRV